MISSHKKTDVPLRPNIFEFLDYRDFLSKMFAYLKFTRRGFSHRLFARQAGFKSSGILTNVICGRKALSVRGAKKTAQGLKLNHSETVFLVDLVLWAHEKKIDRKGMLLERITSNRAFHLMNPLQAAKFKYFSDIRMPLVRELVLAGAKSKNEILKKSRLDLDEEGLSEIIDQLKSLQMIEEKNGEFFAIERQAHTEAEAPSSIIKEYHRKMIHQGIEAMDGIERSLRDIQALTVSLHPDDIAVLKKDLYRFLNHLTSRFEKVSGQDRVVYQVNIQAFPLSK